MTQINEFETYLPLKPSDLSWEEKKKAPESLIFVTEKRNGDIMAKKVADGSKQHTYDGYNKSDGSSPKIALLGPVKRRPKAKRLSKQGITRGSDGKLISLRTGVTAKRRSVLGEGKYGPGSGPQWKAGGTCYPNLYKVFLEEPSIMRRTKLLEDNSLAKEGDSCNVRRPTRAWIMNQ